MVVFNGSTIDCQSIGVGSNPICRSNFRGFKMNSFINEINGVTYKYIETGYGTYQVHRWFEKCKAFIYQCSVKNLSDAPIV